MLVALIMVGTGSVVVAPLVYADTTYCSSISWSACPSVGKTTHGYENHYNDAPYGPNIGYWRASPGHNCTQYVGYMLGQNGNSRHDTLMGNGADWDTSAASLGYAVNGTPAIGSIAQWNGGYGHVAYVEAVGSNSITVSEDDAFSGKFGWRTITVSGDWPDNFLHIADLTQSTVPNITQPNLALNGGFNVDNGYWSAQNVNWQRYASNSNQLSYEGDGYLSTNAINTGGSVYQNISRATSGSHTLCVEAEVTSLVSSGASGRMSLWLLGGSYNESSFFDFSNLNHAVWQPAKTCVTATTAHSSVRVEFYPTIGTPTVGIDAVDLHQSMALNSGMNVDNGYWTSSNANLANYTSNSFAPSYEGNAYLATNTSSGGSVYQDIAVQMNGGNSFCFEAQLSSLSGYSASGRMSIWLMGGSYTESSSIDFVNVPHKAWQPAKTCATATTPHSSIRVEFYPTTNGPTLGIDAADLHQSQILNGGFNLDSGYWTTQQVNWTTYSSNSNQLSYEGAKYLAVAPTSSGGSVRQDVPISTSGSHTYCVEAQVTSLSTSGAAGIMRVWLLGGAYNEASSYTFNNLAHQVWQPAKTCVTATTSHSSIRVEFYPTYGTQTLGIDAVDMH